MMIIDLLHNDLSRITKSGSVMIPKLFSAEKYPTVWQLTPLIKAPLANNVSIYQIFQALFPCGSITDTLKTCTMQISLQKLKIYRKVYIVERYAILSLI